MANVNAGPTRSAYRTPWCVVFCSGWWDVGRSEESGRCLLGLVKRCDFCCAEAPSCVVTTDRPTDLWREAEHALELGRARADEVLAERRVRVDEREDRERHVAASASHRERRATPTPTWETEQSAKQRRRAIINALRCDWPRPPTAFGDGKGDSDKTRPRREPSVRPSLPENIHT